MSSQRPPLPGNTIMDSLKSGALQKDALADTRGSTLVDLSGNPVIMGNADPNAIGADDSTDFSFRGPEAYPEVPSSVKDTEIKFVLPMARFIASALGITVIDESAYDRIVGALRTRSLFVMLNMHNVKVAENVASWFGLVLVCKRHPISLVRFKLNLSTNQVGIDQIRLWSNSSESYVVYRGQEGRFFSREEASTKLINYMKQEGVVPSL